MNDMLALVVFDWAGTTTDYGSQAPVHVFDRTFRARGLTFDRADINAPMGMEKRAHIRAMLSTEKGADLWRKAQGRAWTDADVDALYESFEATLRQVVAAYSHPIPGVPETVEALRRMGLKIGSTTGYTDSMMHIVVPKAAGLSGLVIADASIKDKKCFTKKLSCFEAICLYNILFDEKIEAISEKEQAKKMGCKIKKMKKDKV